MEGIERVGWYCWKEGLSLVDGENEECGGQEVAAFYDSADGLSRKVLDQEIFDVTLNGSSSRFGKPRVQGLGSFGSGNETLFISTGSMR